jgi:hypothetical protein
MQEAGEHVCIIHTLSSNCFISFQYFSQQNSLFGEGTYLSSELSVTMPYCPTGKAWGKSQIGDKLGCVAVCEIIDHPSVKCQTNTNSK